MQHLTSLLTDPHHTINPIAPGTLFTLPVASTALQGKVFKYSKKWNIFRGKTFENMQVSTLKSLVVYVTMVLTRVKITSRVTISQERLLLKV